MENGGPAAGHDASKKVKGCKRHVAVDVEGIPLAIRVHAAGVQDRDGVPEVILSHAGEVADRDQTVSRWWVSEFEACEALADLGLAELLEIVQQPKDLTSFIVLYRCCVVERTFD